MAKRKGSGLRVGIIVFTSLIILLVVIFILGQRGGIFASYYTLKAQFPKVNGLIVGSPVWLAGVDVGYVSDIIFPSNLKSKNLIVVMKIRERYRKYIRNDSKAFIETKGLLGNKIITLTLGSESGRALKNGEFILSVPPLDITEFVSGATASLRNLEMIIEDLKSIGEVIREGKGSLGLLVNNKTLYNQLVSIVSKLNSFVNLLNKKNSSMGKLLNSSELYDNVNNVILSASKGKGTVSKLLHDPSPFVKINSILDRVDRIMAAIEKGQGSAGKIVKDKKLYNQLLKTLDKTSKTLKEIQSLIKDMKTNPQKYIRVKVF